MPQKTNNAVHDGETAPMSDFEALTARNFSPDEVKIVQHLAETLARYLPPQNDPQFDRGDPFSVIEAVIAELDRKLCAQINLIIHSPAFQQLEGTWRGLKFLLDQTPRSPEIKIRVFNISKKMLGKTLKKYKGSAWDQSPIFRCLYEDEFGTAGGKPFGCLIGDYYFDASVPDIDEMRSIARIAAAAHVPFISAAAPEIMNLGSWQELALPRNLSKIFQMPEYTAWRSFRESEDSRYIALTLPRMLSRIPYSIRQNPVGQFNFEEDTGAGADSKYTWMNAAYAMAVNVHKAFAEYSWCSMIRGEKTGGAVYGLPAYYFNSEMDSVTQKIVTESAIPGTIDLDLAKNGFLPLCSWRNSGSAVFTSGQTVYQAKEYDDPKATTNSYLSAQLPYIFAVCRFAHYLKCIMRDKIGTFQNCRDMEEKLNDWVSNYVTGDPNASQEIKAKYPLAEAKVKLSINRDNPGFIDAVFFLRPHYQLDGMTTAFKLVSVVTSSFN